jgi:HAD superfamily hydrolase (TIGR01509 family)
VIFDVDGVLVDSGGAHLHAWQKLGEEIGVPFGRELFDRTFGQRNESIVPSWLGETPPDRVADLGQRKEGIYRDLVRRGEIRIYRRIPDLLAELKRECFAIAVASSGPRENVRLIVEQIGAGPLVDAAVAAEDVSRGKPDPEGFSLAARRIEAPPARCAVVEDSVHGIEAAKRGGMVAVAVLTSTPRDRLAAAGADIFAGEVGDLKVSEIAALIPADSL